MRFLWFVVALVALLAAHVPPALGNNSPEQDCIDENGDICCFDDPDRECCCYEDCELLYDEDSPEREICEDDCLLNC
ncbi:unnamed protein product [Vitrella brassicaformis CCMP3155]|uniref:Tectonic domain-containing protein n=1 Tax=Vitrella brassicaformis (strain CCMP3155) TaxID=1169540 RepID=A0A0G4EM05_VITBC|nr:unnamed protein product [Vitrella brassicaformis CCMP3155]|eukprot:CEL97868.1 unnamed protein product [Vitrella brassicaformis CCMP3155]